jgi:hypothetical protein
VNLHSLDKIGVIYLKLGRFWIVIAVNCPGVAGYGETKMEADNNMIVRLMELKGNQYPEE